MPVSYTHLDVYKRQAYYIPMLLIPTLALYTLFFLDRGQSAPLYKYRYVIFVFPVVLFEPVSYTHLDVYKRQVLPESS